MRRRTITDLKMDFKSDLKQEATGLLAIVLRLLSERAMELLLNLLVKMFTKNRDTTFVDEDGNELV